MGTSYSTRVRWETAGIWQAKRPLLSRLSIELTERCNFSCIHCYINQPAGDQELQAREMTTDQVRAIIKQAAELGALTVHLSGGEPLLRSDLPEIYLFARRLGMGVQLFTNGSLITREIADLFARVPPREKIEISIYGMSPNSYAAVTGVWSAYKAVQHGIQLLLDRRVPFLIKGALLPPNEHEITEFRAWAATLPGMNAEADLSIFYNLRAHRDSEEKNRRINALRISPEAGTRVLAHNPQRYRREMVQFCSKFIGPAGDRLFRCHAGEPVCLDAYGKLQACLLLRHPDTIYDLIGAKSSLRQGLEYFFPWVHQQRAQNREYLDRCARCFLMGLCRQCPAKSWMEHGSLDTPVEYLCAVAHAEARGLGLLHEGEHGWEIMDWRKRVEHLQITSEGG